jgi:hypothetical protein
MIEEGEVADAEAGAEAGAEADADADPRTSRIHKQRTPKSLGPDYAPLRGFGWIGDCRFRVYGGNTWDGLMIYGCKETGRKRWGGEHGVGDDTTGFSKRKRPFPDLAIGLVDITWECGNFSLG